MGLNYSISFMVKFLKPGKVVLVLNGRYAGKKAIIIKTNDDGTSSRPYGHALVIGLSKIPRKVTRSHHEKTQKAKTKIKAFIKIFNYTHIMPTRYSVCAEDLKANLTSDTMNYYSKKVAMRKECKQILEDKFRMEKVNGSLINFVFSTSCMCT